MIISLTEHFVGMTNSLPSKVRVSDDMSHFFIVEGKSNIDLSKNRLPKGVHVQVWIGNTNNMTERTVPGIDLRVSSSEGGINFMSLHSGKRMRVHVWQELSISEEVADRVEELENPTEIARFVR